ncbi:lysophospholipid acyltransferase family protein [Nocardia sp. NPDC058658]|uniref:lysophospholipid acyltransferase family protein n=1 Tax=Nocardia sp. NPDC058658 TaxID=3346580 RepID=UPI0036477E8E
MGKYFAGTGLRGRFKRWFFTAAGQVPVDRTGGDAAAVGILERGGVWAIHPEGTRSRDGRVYRGRTGALRVAMATGAPVVPVVLDGSDRMNPRGRKLLRFTKVRITVHPARHYSAAGHHAQVRVATDLLMREIAALSGRPYVDRYAASFAVES